MLITEIEAIGVQLKPETYIEWSIALNVMGNSKVRKWIRLICLVINLNQLSRSVMTGSRVLASY